MPDGEWLRRRPELQYPDGFDAGRVRLIRGLDPKLIKSGEVGMVTGVEMYPKPFSLKEHACFVALYDDGSVYYIPVIHLATEMYEVWAVEEEEHAVG